MSNAITLLFLLVNQYAVVSERLRRSTQDSGVHDGSLEDWVVHARSYRLGLRLRGFDCWPLWPPNIPPTANLF